MTFLCLPDDAAREAVALAGDADVRIIDASTAHRTNPDWAYGFPELSRNTGKRSAPQACGSAGLLCQRLCVSGVSHGTQRTAAKDYPVQCFAMSGYSGGGKKMIAEIESPDRAPELYSPRFYGLANNHKHLPEMQKISGLEKKPMFTPIVDDYYNGMVVCVPIQAAVSGFSLEPERVQEMLERHYEGSNFVHVQPLKTPAEMTATKLSCNDLRDTNQMEIFVFGDAEQILLCSRLDNLGKGASGAAVQCMNIMLGLDETVGLL